MEDTDNSRRGIGEMLKGNLMIFVATLFFGINIPVVKMLIPQWMTAMDVTVFRLMGGCLLMWLASTFIKTTPIRRGDWLPIILAGAVASSLLTAIALVPLRLSTKPSNSVP